MAPRELPRLVEEALRDMAPCDARETMADIVRQRLPALKKQARHRGEAIVNRGALVCAVAGDAAGCDMLAAAYAKALHGFEITAGHDDNDAPVINTVNWADIIADEQGRPLPFTKALDKLYAAKSEAEGGVLVIRDIYARSEEKFEQSRNGAYQMLHDLLSDYAEKDYTPVVVLTGKSDEMDNYFKNNPAIAQYFTTPTVAAVAPPPPPVPASVDLQTAVTVKRPLTLRRP